MYFHLVSLNSADDINIQFTIKAQVIQCYIYIIYYVYYVIKCVSDLRHVGGFLRFPPPIKLTATI